MQKFVPWLEKKRDIAYNVIVHRTKCDVLEVNDEHCRSLSTQTG